MPISGPGGTTGGGPYIPPGQYIPYGTPGAAAADAEAAARGAYQQMRTGYGAMAYSPSTGRVQTAWNHASRDDAEASVRQGLPSDAHIYWGHHTYVALAQGPAGYGFGCAASAMAAMQQALQASADPGARVTALISTDYGERDPQQEWAWGLRTAAWRGELKRSFRYLGWYLLIAPFILLVALVGSQAPAAAFLLIAVAIAFFVWRRRRRR